MQPPETASQSPPVQADGGLFTDWFSPGRFATLLALLIFATFPQVRLGRQTFVMRDYGFFAYPLAHFQREAFWRGELPLWNPYSLRHANYAFQAVEVPAGKYRVRVAYVDSAFQIGAGISGAALVASVIGLTMGRRGRR